jgi:hypothetical protein
MNPSQDISVHGFNLRQHGVIIFSLLWGLRLWREGYLPHFFDINI